MVAQLSSFLIRKKPTLQVFCPDQTTVVTSFESYLPEAETIFKTTDSEPCLPTAPCWLKQNYEYFAFLPKEHWFGGHLLTSLNFRRSQPIKRDSRWYLDDETRNIWRSLDLNLTKSINVIGGGLLVDLEHFEPAPAVKYGFSHGHKSERNLRISLALSKKAIVHRLAYLAYIISIQYQWDQDLVSQAWWRDFTQRCSPTWVDGIWDTIYRQWNTRNFTGVVAKPVTSTVRWLNAALKFGVPIWVFFPAPGAFGRLDGGFVMKQWEPTTQQVDASRQAQSSKVAALATPTTPPHPSNLPSVDQEPEDNPIPPLDPPASSITITPPSVLPDNARWYESWQRFFEDCDRADAQYLQVATEVQKVSWESKTRNAKGFPQPGRRGAPVYVWEECDSGGFFRILQTRHRVAEDWGAYFRQALIFRARTNSWDYVPFVWGPAVETGSPDDLDDDRDNDDGHIMEHWYYTERVLPKTLQDANPEPLEFLYHRYGFLAIEPTAPPVVAPVADGSTALRIAGLDPETSGKPPVHLKVFINKIIQREFPAGCCDLCSTSPPDQAFAGKTLIHDTVFFWQSPDLSDEVLFVFLNIPNNSPLLIVHEALSVLQLVRVGTQMELRSQLQFLVLNGSRFTLLYPNAQRLSPLAFYPLTFPIRDAGWSPDAEDYRAYTLRVKTFFEERPHLLAAALSRGGIAWRITLEVLGIEESVDKILDTYPDQRSPVSTSRGIYWSHKPDEGDWFYLVGGYEVLTGLCTFFGEQNYTYGCAGYGDQRLDLSWWPKVTTWEASGINVGCWTPLCEHWFKKCADALRSGKARPYTSTQWGKNLRYEKKGKAFFSNIKNIGRDFLIQDCRIKEI